MEEQCQKMFSAHKNARPDIVILYGKLQKIVLLEITCSCEKDVDSADISKRKKYQDLTRTTILARSTIPPTLDTITYPHIWTALQAS